MSGSKRFGIQEDEHFILQGSPLSHGLVVEEPSLHEIRMANAIKLGPGSYRLPEPRVSPSILLPIKRTLKSSGKDASSSEPHKEEYSLVSDMAYFKMGAIAEKSPVRKKVYYPDTNVTDNSFSRRPIRVIRRVNTNYHDSTSISMDKIMEPRSNGITSANSNEQPNLLIEPTIDVDGYEEVADAAQYGDGPENMLPPFLVSNVSNNHEVISGATYRELKGENNYLKEQLHASFLKIKQLEALLMERNERVKNLVSENVQLLIQSRKLIAALGEEEAREVLS